MAIFLDKFRKLLGSTSKPTASQLEKLVSEGEREAERAAEALATLVSRRAEALLAGAGAEHLEQVAAARQAVDDAALALDHLRQRLAAAQEGEAEAARQRAYDTAIAARARAAEAVRVRYPALAAELVGLIRTVSEADMLIEAANGNLPAGAWPLDSTEGIARDRPHVAAEVVDERVVEMWAVIGAATPAARQGDVRDLGGGRGRKTIPGPFGSTYVDYVRQRFVARRVRTALPGEVGPRISQMAVPPLLAGDAAAWLPAGYDMSPGEILRRLDALAAEPVPAAEVRPIVTEYAPVPDAPAVAAE